MDGSVEIYQTSGSYILINKPCALHVKKPSGDITITAEVCLTDPDVVRLGVAEGILGRFRCSSEDNWNLLLAKDSTYVCSLYDGTEIRQLSKIAVLPITDSALPKVYQISKSSQKETQLLQVNEHLKQPAIVQAVQTTIKAASDIINFKQRPKGSKRLEMRIIEVRVSSLCRSNVIELFHGTRLAYIILEYELEKLFEGDSDQFYFSRGGSDLTLWTQRREARRASGELCAWSDLERGSRTFWRPLWCRYDSSFVWNDRILQDLVTAALTFLITELGLPEHVTTATPSNSSPVFQESYDATESLTSTSTNVEGTGQRTFLTECLCALESMLIPIISGFVKQDKPVLPMWDVDGGIRSPQQDIVTFTIISRRSKYRAGCRYRRRGIDENGYVANYVETEQIVEIPGEPESHILSFLQLRGSVPVFWTQTGIKYKPPIQLNRSLSENREAFQLHVTRSLNTFDRLVVVNLVETTPGRQESKITEAFVQQLLLLDNPQVTYVGFDFHEYCKGLRFGNVEVLLAGVRDIIREMKYFWLHKSYVMCKQESVFRVNCVDCLDRTNLVQSVFATAIMEIQLNRLGRLPPEVEPPVEFARAVQALWADNGDALSRHYTGTAAMKGDYTRTGARTVNGLMKDGVSSMSRYYQRFGEIKRQAAIDFLLGYEESPELRFLQNCSTPDVTQEIASIEVSAILSSVRLSCLESDEDSFFEFVATSSILKPRRTGVRAFGMLTSKYLHIVRFIVSSSNAQQAHIRIPVRCINHVSFDTETALFKQPSPVLRIYFTLDHPVPSRLKPAQADSTDEPFGRRSRQGSSSGVVSTPSSVLKRTSALQKQVTNRTGGTQYLLDLRQAPFRLFNNYLVPVAGPEEATDALRAVAESIIVLLQSIHPEVDLEAPLPTSSAGSGKGSRGEWLSVMQRRRLEPCLPTEYVQPLPTGVCECLAEHRDRLYPFLLPPSAAPSAFRAPSRHPQQCIPSATMLVEKKKDGEVQETSIHPVASISQSSQKFTRLRGFETSSSTNLMTLLPHSTGKEYDEALVERECIEERAAGGENGSRKSTASSVAKSEADGSELMEQGFDVLLGSNIDESQHMMVTATLKNKNSRFCSFSDLLSELEDAAERGEEGDYDNDTNDDTHDDADDDVQFGTIGSRTSLISREEVEGISWDPDANLTTGPTKHALTERRSGEQIRTSAESYPGTPRRCSFSEDHRNQMAPNIGQQPQSVSDPNIFIYRSLYRERLRFNPEAGGGVSLATSAVASIKESSSQRRSRSILGEDLGRHFVDFTLGQIKHLEDTATPRFVARLRRRQAENAILVDRLRTQVCPSQGVIKTHFLIF